MLLNNILLVLFMKTPTVSQSPNTLLRWPSFWPVFLFVPRENFHAYKGNPQTLTREYQLAVTRAKRTNTMLLAGGLKICMSTWASLGARPPRIQS